MTEQDRLAASTSQTFTQGGTQRKTSVSPRRHCISAKQSGEGWVTNVLQRHGLIKGLRLVGY